MSIRLRANFTIAAYQVIIIGPDKDMLAGMKLILHINKTQLLVAAGYDYQEKIEQEQQDSVAELQPSVSNLPTFETQAELEAYLQILTQSFDEKLSEYSKQRGYSQLKLA